MNKFIVFFIGIVVLFAVAMSGMLTPSKTDENTPVNALASCVDFDPPNQDEFITFNGTKYDLLKKDAGISAGKMGEMQKIGSVEGMDIYKLVSTNYFGQAGDDNIIYKLKEIDKTKNYIFDIYIKDGVLIPDYIKNCKPIGGSMQVVIGDKNMFPPSGFNKADITGLTDNTIAPAFVLNKDGNKSFDSVKNLARAAQIGTLKVATKNKYYSLYLHLGTIYLIDDPLAYEYLPSQTPIDFSKKEDKSLQLKKIDFVSTPTYSWWTPECKPAIYLYPQEKTEVNVQVKPLGFLTLTIPDYPTGGWNVTAFPDGTIYSNGEVFPYLYYESMINDSKFNKPTSGFVVSFYDLPVFYESVLPKLGLSQNQTQDFKSYWQKALPFSPYYFVGIMEKEDIDKIEPLTITPNPSTVIRIRLYFEALENWISVNEPIIVTPKRKGFTVVEWGGMVKRDENHPFVCSE
ncbi:MAG: hypothetical protein Q8P80_00460 [Candidatus Levybacteria bacterium]|nr:hypothetical protein [Candidatus Levybacteria bacterium]